MIVTALFCAFCQILVSCLLLIDFISADFGEKEATEEANADQSNKLESNVIIIVKFICAALFHFKFEAELKNGMMMMKYVVMHPHNFKYYVIAFLMGFFDMIMIFFCEFVNLYNLSNINEGVRSLMFDFIALGIIAEFDDFFFMLYKYVSISNLVKTELVFENVKKPKRQ